MLSRGRTAEIGEEFGERHDVIGPAHVDYHLVWCCQYLAAQTPYSDTGIAFPTPGTP